MTRALLLALNLCLIATTPARPDDAGKPAVRAGIYTEIYGFVKLDAAWNDGRLDPGDFARWVMPEAAVDGAFHMTARQTRLGLRFHVPDEGGLDARGRVEIDFYGGVIENKSGLLFRHGFVDLAWKAHGFSLLAGQTSDLISPLVPATINYSVAWWAGNIGYRRPQIRLTGDIDAGRVRLVLQAAATAAIGAEYRGTPGGQGRVAVSFFLRDRPAVIGVSGHISNAGLHATSWSGNLDVTFPIGSRLDLKAEGWLGQALAEYLGGVGHSYNDSLDTAIRARGGWAALAMKPFDRWAFNTGAGIDDPDDDDLSGGERSRNVNVFANAMYQLRPNVTVGAEVSWWETAYMRAQTWSSWRGQLTFILTV